MLKEGTSCDTDTEVGTVQALGLPQETVVYGLQEDEEEEEGVFEIGSSSGEITVGPNGTDNLVIKVGPSCVSAHS